MVTSKPTLTLSMLREVQRKAKEEEAAQKNNSLAATAVTAAAEVSMIPFYAIMRIARWASSGKKQRAASRASSRQASVDNNGGGGGVDSSIWAVLCVHSYFRCLTESRLRGLHVLCIHMCIGALLLVCDIMWELFPEDFVGCFIGNVFISWTC